MPGFLGSSAGKESTCNAEDPGLIPRLGRSPGEGIGYPCQYSWAFLVAQLVKNPLAMQETRVQSLVWGDPLEEGMATHSSILAWRSPWTEEPRGLQSIGSQRVGHDWATNTARGGTLSKAFSLTKDNSKRGWQWRSIKTSSKQPGKHAHQFLEEETAYLYIFSYLNTLFESFKNWFTIFN